MGRFMFIFFDSIISRHYSVLVSPEEVVVGEGSPDSGKVTGVEAWPGTYFRGHGGSGMRGKPRVSRESMAYALKPLFEPVKPARVRP